MRFIKKSDTKNLKNITRDYKEIELYTARSDFEDFKIKENIDEIRKVFNENKAIITAIHCPPSRFKTSIDSYISTNYMSFSEVIFDLEEQEMFRKLCSFANEIATYYGEPSKQIDTEKECDESSSLERKDTDSFNKKHENYKILIILHTGCIHGCTGTNSIYQDFKCSCQSQIGQGTCSAITQNENINKFRNIVEKFRNVQIVFENITPFYDGDKIGKNCGYNFENFNIAKLCNAGEHKKSKEESQFGVVIDFCHLIATHSLLSLSGTKIDYIKKYFDRIELADKKLIRLFHLSNYKNGLHGEQFEEQEDVDEVRNICLENARSVPITLEVNGSEDSKIGAVNFNKMMLDWSKLHILLKDYLEKDLYNFFEDLFYIYAKDYQANKQKFYRIANQLKRYIIDSSQLEQKLFGITRDRQDININLFQVQAYIYYMRYCNLALDLKEKYKGDISVILKHYIFNDRYEEIRFDGIGYYYNIFWIKRDINLYRCNDEVLPKKILNGGFEDILLACKKHITGENLQFLSYSKCFGRNMLKYFNPYSNEYNIEIVVKTPINFVSINRNNKTTFISLQEYIDFKCDYNNFSIDFSDFCGERGDSNKEGSLFELLKKVGLDIEKIRKDKIGSIYDQEVIFYNEPCEYTERKQYKLNKTEYALLMIAYQIILKEFEKEPITISDLIDYLIFFENESIINFIGSESLSTIKKRDSIIEILECIDFRDELEVNYDNEGYNNFTKSFIPKYKGFINLNLNKLITDYKISSKEAVK
ncbi:hypothetical protein ACQKMV_07865 [Lysinibacillus sp. NPDC094403]|uniref:hypothetical protein n=1 Tax=Lysinibacillus sp. NPDC094403 TaxID=3390581 RepID=UPI003D08598E